MAQIEIALTTESVDPESVRGKTCVVIDILRASTTIVTALANGCPAIIPVGTPEEARRIAKERNCLLGGERKSVRLEGFDFGNSPLEYTREKIAGRPIAFTTTNGTRAMRKCTAASKLFVASFVNAGATARLLRNEENDTLIVCAGTRGEPTAEDTACGGMLIDALGAGGTLEADEAVSLWNNHKADLATMMKTTSAHGQSLVEIGFEKDIDFAARVDEYNIPATRENDSIVGKR